MHALKQQLRIQIRAKRRSLNAQEQTRIEKIICHRLLNSHFFKQAQTIALYLPFEGEVSTYLILQQALVQHKSCYAPVLANKKLSFAKLDLQTPLKPNRFGILEPCYPHMALISGHALDMVVMPLVGFDNRCHRLGMGGGFYDKTFSFRKRGHKPALVGIAYDFQRIIHLPRSVLDLSLDEVITEKHHYKP